MEKEFEKYDFKALAEDPSFRNWVLYPDPANTLFWETWLAENPEMHKTVHMARNFLTGLQETNTDLEEYDLEEITDSIIRSGSPKYGFGAFREFLRVAAAFIILAASFFLLYRYGSLKQQKEEYADLNSGEDLIEYRNDSQDTKNIVLSDGSKIILYPKSRIRYPHVFSDSLRKIFLSGQAFFDIEKNPQRPFWVYTKYLSTQVLGTSFMISAFENTADVKVEVKTGKVSVYTRRDLKNSSDRHSGPQAGMILTPNQQVTFSKKEARLVKSIVQKPEQIITLKKEEFRFEETPVSVVFTILEKAYGIPIIFDAQHMTDCYLTASLEEEDLYQKLDMICRVTRSYYEIVDAQIVIHSRGC